MLETKAIYSEFIKTLDCLLSDLKNNLNTGLIYALINLLPHNPNF